MENEITLRQVAEVLGIKYDLAKRWSSEGRLPAPVRKFNSRNMRWDKKEIEAFGLTKK